MQDAFLLKRASGGDTEAFIQLVSPYEKKLYFWCLGTLKNPEDAKDCVQETLIKAFRGIGQFRSDASLSTWLYRIAYRCCVDMLRKSRPIDALPDADADAMQLTDRSPQPYEALEAKERLRLLNEAISRLPDEHRLPLLLFVQGEDYATISEVLSVKLGTVKSRISRAREHLKEILAQDMELYGLSDVEKHEGRHSS